ncbi:MAG: VOC family protein [Alphaproteobacteria bacterium]
MSFKFTHFNFNVMSIENSKKFYKEALGLEEKRRINGEDFIIVYLKDEKSDFELELTELKSHPQKYNLGEVEFHLAFTTPDYEASLEKHKKMNCVEFINEDMGIYFIVDPDGYWIEILPEKHK